MKVVLVLNLSLNFALSLCFQYYDVAQVQKVHPGKVGIATKITKPSTIELLPAPDSRGTLPLQLEMRHCLFRCVRSEAGNGEERG